MGSGAAGGGGDHARSKEAAGMMALHEALRNVCLSSDWTYSVFWTIRPRPYAPLSFLPFSSPLLSSVHQPIHLLSLLLLLLLALGYTIEEATSYLTAGDFLS